MEILSSIIVQNSDIAMLTTEVVVNADENISTEQIAFEAFYRGFAGYPPDAIPRMGDDSSAFVHVELLEGEGETSIWNQAFEGWSSNGTTNARVLWNGAPDVRYPMASMFFRSSARALFRVTIAFLKRGGNWLQRNWRCETCKIAVRAILNAAFSAIGLPPPDLFEAIPLDRIGEIFEKLIALLGEDHPITRIIRQLLNQPDFRPPGLGALSDLICRWLGICPEPPA